MLWAAARFAMARSSSAPAFPRRLGRCFKRSRRASVTTWVMDSPVSRAMAAARRCASGSFMLRDRINSVYLPNFLPFYPNLANVSCLCGQNAGSSASLAALTSVGMTRFFDCSNPTLTRKARVKDGAPRLILSDNYPPAMAPMMRRGSVPLAIASGRGFSGSSWDQSSSQAKKRRKARRSSVC